MKAEMMLISMIVDTPKHQRRFTIKVPATNSLQDDEKALEALKKCAYRAGIGIPRNGLAKLGINGKVRFKGGYADSLTMGVD